MTVSLSINGAAPVAADSLGWSFETMARRNASPDVVTLKRVRQANAALDITEGTQVVVFVDGQRTFTGTAQAAQFGLGEQGSRVTVPVFGPWWHLARLNFTRAALHFEGVSVVATQLPPEVGTLFTVPGAGSDFQEWNGSAWVPASPGTTYKWARVENLALSPKEIDIAKFVGARGLLSDPNWSGMTIYRTVFEGISELLTYTLEVHDRLGLPVPFTVDLSQLETDLGATASPKYRTWQDQKVAACMSGLLASKPDVAIWFDYSSEIPELRMRSASVETEQALTPGAPPLMRIQATPRPELKPDGVVVRWEYQTVLDAAYRGYRIPAYVDKWPLDILPHEPGVMTYTVDYVSAIGSFKPAMAQALMEAVGILRATGSMSLTMPLPQEAAQIRPGLTYRLAGDPALNDVQLLVQDVSWNVEAGTVECSLGYPRALDLQTLSDLRGWITWTMGDVTTVLTPPP